MRLCSPSVSLVALLALVVALTGCGPAPTAAPDAARQDAAPAPDAALLDGAAPDAASDAGPTPDLPALAVPCVGAPDDVYAATPDAATSPLDARGAIRACTYDGFVSAADLTARLAAVGVTTVVPSTGVHVLRVAFQTTRRGDVAAVSSARVLLPASYARTPSPQLVSAHGTAGLSDTCAPSRAPTQGDALVLPYASTGWPVIAPDYAGLGTAGVQGYGDNEDTARSQLDAARALRALLPSGILSDAIVMDGHSQGGGVVLSAQALEATYGAGGDLALVLAFAPGWPIGRDVTGYRFPGVSTALGDGAPAAIASYFHYAWQANAIGEATAGDGFGAAVRADVTAAVESQCVFDLASSFPAIAPTFGDLIDDTLRTGLIACADGGTCTGTAQQMWDWMGANVLHADPAGATVAIYTGSADTLATPNDVSCIVGHLQADTVTPSVCVDGSTHFDVVGHGAAHMLAYANAVIDGTTPPACPSTGSLPACR